MLRNYKHKKLVTRRGKDTNKSEKITPFGGIFPIMDEFNRVLSGIVDSTLGFRCKLFGYQYSEIIRLLMCVYFCTFGKVNTPIDAY